MKKEIKKRVKKVVEVIPESIETPPVEVATGESEAKKELRAYIEKLKATDVHEYTVREARLLKELNELK